MNDKTFHAERSLTLLDAGGVANRVVATTNGTAMSMAQVSSAMLAAGIGARAATKIVATNNPTWASSAGMQASADYLCDGVADEVQINAALAALPSSGGTVLVAEGLFILAAPIVFGGVRRRLQGMGLGVTLLRVMDAGTSAINATIIQMNNDYNELSDLELDGNKANNASQTGTTGVTISGNNSSLMQRVRINNVISYGLVVLANVANGVIRDCIVENSGFRGAVFRAAAGQPLVVTGCIFRANTGYGVWFDSGPVVMTDCHSLNNNSYGYDIDSTSFVIMHECTAQNNASSGWQLEGSNTRTILSACRGIGNGNNNTRSDASQTMYINCVMHAAAGNSHGIFTVGADCMVYGCTSSDNYHGFIHALTNRAMYVACRAINNQEQSFSIGNGSVLIGGCQTYGRATTGFGIAMDGSGGNHLVDGCRIKNHGADGIVIGGPLSNVQVSDTFISDVSLATNATYKGLVVVGDACFIHGNTLRDPAAGNRPLHGMHIDGGSVNSMLGLNDAFGAGVSGGNPPNLYDVGTGTRRTLKLLLDYVASADLIGTVTVANTWTDVVPNQTFTVASPGSVIEIAARGSILCGAITPGTICVTRLLIDGATVKNLSGDIEQTSTSWQNIMAGAQPVKIEGLTVGDHTVKLQMLSNVVTNVYCRPATQPLQECMAIQVTEYQR